MSFHQQFRSRTAIELGVNKRFFLTLLKNGFGLLCLGFEMGEVTRMEFQIRLPKWVNHY